MAYLRRVAPDLGNESMKKWLFLFIITSSLFLGCSVASETDSDLVLEATKVSVQVFEIPANQKWADTKIKVGEGDDLHISYFSGTLVDGDEAVADAMGSGYICGHSDCCEPLPSVPRLALIGRVGKDIFYIGNGGILEMPATGNLYLRVNDCDSGLYDNSGNLSIIIFP